MKRTLIFLIAVLASAISVNAQCSEGDKKALQDFDTAWAAAGITGDRAALMNMYADDFVAMPAMTGKTYAIDGAMRTFERTRANPAMASKTVYDAYLISCTPNTATVTHRNIISPPAGPDGKSETFWTRSVHILEKRGGKWQAVANASNEMDDYMTLGYLERDWNDAVLKRDKGWFEKNFADDYSSVSSATAALTNKADDIADAMKGGHGENWNQLSDMNVRVDGNTAVVTGVNHVKGKDDKGAAFERKVRFTDTWIKRDGRWQVLASQGTDIPEPVKTAKN